MANEVVPFGKGSVVPAYAAKFFEKHENIREKVTVNQLSYRGKVWRIVIDGVEKPLMKDDEPVSTVHVVVLAQQEGRSRAYYEGAYVAGKNTPPVCSSMDGKVPDSIITEPKSKSCQTCKFSEKGSKITPAGKQASLCSVFKRIVVVPLADIESEPLLLRMAQTSIWDKNNEEGEAKGFYGWDQYQDMLRTHGVRHTAAVATKIRFDPRMEYPKLVFGTSRWLVEDEQREAAGMADDPRVSNLLIAHETAVAARKEEADDEEEAQSPKAKPAEEDAPPPKKAKPADDDDDVPPPKKKAKADDEEPPAKSGGWNPAPPRRGKAKADDAEEAPAAKKKDDAGLGALVGEWDD